MNIYNIQNLFPSGTVLSAARTSKAVPIQNNLFYCIQVVVTGTPTGTFKLQSSNDNSATMTAGGQTPYTPVNWVDIANTSTAVSAAGTTVWHITYAAYNFVRVVYADGSSGSSTAVITVSTFNAKG